MLVLRNQDDKIAGFSDRKEIYKVMFLKLTEVWEELLINQTMGTQRKTAEGKQLEAVLESVKNDSKFPAMNLIMCEKKANINFWHLI